ncbi:MAG TPA: nucleotide exchange factor GrpE [Candidatus Peribacteraceae bacterium]|nr:nucleotide exchange factor GrpE [Candidatus Peribacteraceae bacterium]
MTTQKKPQGDEPKPDPKILELQGKIAELTDQVKKLTELAARAQADLQNAKMRMTKDQEELRKFVGEGMLQALLPTVDNFQRAFQHLPDELRSHDWVKGVASIEQDLIRKLGEMGLKRFESLGKPVDPLRHEVLTTGPGEEGKVIEVFEDGYELHGKILRPAKVKVGAGNSQ